MILEMPEKRKIAVVSRPFALLSAVLTEWLMSRDVAPSKIDNLLF